MKLYYSPAACSLSPHIVLREAGIAFTLEKIDLQTKTLANGSDFNRINAKSYVPVLELDNGERLTEGSAIVQFIADLVPGSKKEEGLIKDHAGQLLWSPRPPCRAVGGPANLRRTSVVLRLFLLSHRDIAFR